MEDQAPIRSALERNVKVVSARPSVGQGVAVTRATLGPGLSCEVTEGPWRLAVGMTEIHGAQYHINHVVARADGSLAFQRKGCGPKGFVVDPTRTVIAVGPVRVGIIICADSAQPNLYDLLLKAGDYDGAITALDKPPDKFAADLADRLKAERDGVRRQAEEKIGAATAAAER